MGIGAGKRTFFVVKTWIKRGFYVVVVVVSLVLFGFEFGWSGGRGDFRIGREKRPMYCTLSALPSASRSSKGGQREGVDRTLIE